MAVVRWIGQALRCLIKGIRDRTYEVLHNACPTCRQKYTLIETGLYGGIYVCDCKTDHVDFLAS